MNHDLINEIAICIIVAWVLAIGAQLLRQPLILAYLVAGLAVGPVGLSWVTDQATIETISALGLILLLFMVGLEIDLKKILGSGRLILVTAALQIFGGCLLGWVFFRALGFGAGDQKLDALYLAVAAGLSSTVIIVKILYDKRELDTLAGRLTLGILVLQDVCAILFLALQPDLRSTGVTELGLSLAKAMILVAAAFAASRFALPPLFRAVARLPELVQVGALAWCFLVSGLAGYLGLSREMGALVAGIALSTFPYTLDVTARVSSLRDFFVTLFFVALGMKIPPLTLPVAKWAGVMALFVVASRFLTVFAPLHAMKQGMRVSFLTAINLSQASEFSLVILALGLQSAHITKATFDIGAYAFVFLAVLSSYGILQSHHLVHGLRTLFLRLGFRDLDQRTDFLPKHRESSSIYLLGFSWVGSSLLEEIERHDPHLLRDLAVIDFNPLVNERLRERGVQVIYGDIGQRGTLLHAGVDQARTIVCTLANTVLKGTTNLRLLQELRAINAHAQIIMHAELLEDVPKLYQAGASFVLAPRIGEATELLAVIEAARLGLLDQKRAELERQLKGRREIIP